TITTTLRGAAPEEVESQVTKRIEEAVNTISGIDDLSSLSAQGISQVNIQFVLSKDADGAAQEVRDKVARIQSQLPRDTDPPIVDKIATDASPVINVVLSSPRDLRETTKLVDDRVKKNLESLPGVGQVRFVGDRQRQIQVMLDAGRLFAYNLNIDQVRAALASQNVEIPGGRLDQGAREVSVRTLGRIETPADFNRVIVSNQAGVPVRISDIAEVVDGYQEPRSLTRLDGVPSVALEIRKQSGTNTLEVIRVVKERIAELRPLLPADLKIAYTRDQSTFISEAFSAVQEHLVLGGVLAGIIVMLFIRSWRSTVIAAIAIPTSIISTYTLMNMMGFTLNQITMLGLVLVVGIVIDDAIVVLENIFRFMEEKGLPPVQAAIKGTEDIGLAVMATTLSLVIIFLPVAFMEGIVGRFMSSFGFTAAFAIMVSLLVSFTLTPMLCSRWLRFSPGEPTKETWLFRVTARPYRAMLLWSMRHRWVIVMVSLAVTFSSVPLYMRIGKSFLPIDDQSEFEVTVRMPPGSSLEGTDQMMRQVEDDLRQMKGIRNVFTTIGADVRQQVDRGTVLLELVPASERTQSQAALMLEARHRMARFHDVVVSVQLPSLIAGGDSREMMFSLQGPDLIKLDHYAGVIIKRLAAEPGVVDLDSNYEPGKPELRVVINRDKAADLNVNVGSIATALRTLVGGDEQATTYREGDDRYDVLLRVKKEYRTSAEAMQRLYVPSATLGNVPLSNVAQLLPSTGPTQIARFNRQRQVMIMANVAEGQSLSNVITILNQTVDSLQLPPEYRTGMVGRSREFERAGKNYVLALLLSLVLMYMILAAQFESFIDPITILLSLPLSVPFALLSLLLAGENFSIIYSSVGILVLFGIVKKNSILQIDHIKSLRRQGSDRMQAILYGCEDRLRPILMTTAALVAGMIPMALGGGAGSGSRRTVAIVVIGGQTLCLLLTLLVTPVAYSLFDDLAAVLSRWSRRIRFRAAAPVATLLLVCVAFAQEPARVGVSITQRKLTLSEALKAALKSNLEIEIERTTVANAHLGVKAAQGAFDGMFRWLPSVESRTIPTPSILMGAGGKLEETSLVQNFQYQQRLPWHGASFLAGFDNSRQTTTNPFTGLTPYYGTRMMVQFAQPLMRGLKADPYRTELKLRSRNTQISELDLELKAIDVVARVEQAYWNLVAARQDVQVQSDAVKLAQEQLDRTRRMIASGTLASVEIAAAEAELERRKDNHLSSIGLLAEVENAFKLLLSAHRSEEIWTDAIIPLEERTVDFAAADDLPQAVSAAMGKRAELRQLAMRKQNNDAQKDLAANQLKPQMNLVASYSAAGLAGAQSDIDNPFTQNSIATSQRINQLSALNGIAPLPPTTGGGIPPAFLGGYPASLSTLFEGGFPTVQVGVSLEWTTRNRTAEAGLGQTVVAERRLKLERDRIEQAIVAQVRNAIQSLTTSRQRILAAEASAHAAQEKLESEIRLFQSGESTNFLVLTRQNEFSDSRRRVVVARLDFNKAVSRLRQSMGTTLEAHNLHVQ
ncbi:MAG: efflux RND transporter permease subunit, partial [Acidobacteriia bacterium]|nr:efflux RND transporter permease subunit [Terriglobia bacterium]